MQFSKKDVLASALVGAAVAAYLGYLVFGGVPLVQDVRGMAAVGLILGFASRFIGGREGFRHPRVARIGSIACIALGFVALGTESEVVLAVFMALMVGLWLAAMFVHMDWHRSRALRPSQS